MDIKNIIFRCDGGKNIGFGHVKRCLSLAYEFSRSHRANIIFAMRHDDSAIDIVKSSGHQVLLISDSEDKSVYKLVIQNKPDAIFFDVRDGTTRAEIEKIKKLGIKVILIDDAENRRLSADYVFYPPVPQVKKLDWENALTNKYIGWEWVFLNKNFYESLGESVEVSSHKEFKLLITMGGVDPLDVSNTVVSYLAAQNYGMNMILILGPGYAGVLKKEVSLPSLDITMLRSPDNMSNVMSKVNFAISAFGVTAYELAAAKIPTLLLCKDENDYLAAKSFEDEGFSLRLNSKDMTANDFYINLKLLLKMKFPENNNIKIGSGLKKVYGILWP